LARLFSDRTSLWPTQGPASPSVQRERANQCGSPSRYRAAHARCATSQTVQLRSTLPGSTTRWSSALVPVRAISPGLDPIRAWSQGPLPPFDRSPTAPSTYGVPLSLFVSSHPEPLRQDLALAPIARSILDLVRPVHAKEKPTTHRVAHLVRMYFDLPVQIPEDTGFHQAIGVRQPSLRQRFPETTGRRRRHSSFTPV